MAESEDRTPPRSFPVCAEAPVSSASPPQVILLGPTLFPVYFCFVLNRLLLCSLCMYCASNKFCVCFKMSLCRILSLKKKRTKVLSLGNIIWCHDSDCCQGNLQVSLNYGKRSLRALSSLLLLWIVPFFPTYLAQKGLFFTTYVQHPPGKRSFAFYF